MTKDEIVHYLECLSGFLEQKGVVGEIVLFGGAAMVLAHQARISTKDVDAVFVPKSEIHEAAERVERLHGAPEKWLNDAVKGFLSGSPETHLFYDWPGLKVYVAGPEYLLAMKCLSMRLGRDQADLDDIRFLMAHLGIQRAEQVLDLVEKYYPVQQILPKTRFALEELCQDLERHE